MKIQSDELSYAKNNALGLRSKGYFIYPFFLIHMLAFGWSGFFLAYGGDEPDVMFNFMHGGIAIVVYIAFYFAIFGREEVKWMFINAGLGILGIYSQIGWILDAWLGKHIADYPYYLHLVPFTYYVLYTFLLRQAVLQITGARDNEQRRRWVDNAYIAISLAVYLGLLIFKT